MSITSKSVAGLLIIICFGLVPLLWDRRDFLLSSGDEWWYIDPGNLLNAEIYTWDTILCNYGGPSLSTPQAFPVSLFWVVLKGVGFSTVLINKLWILLLFLLPGVSMYFFMSVVYNRFEAKIVSSLLYMFNLYVIVVEPFQSNVKPVMIAIPLMLGFLIKGLQSKEFVKYSILIGLSSLVYAESNVNPPMVAIIPAILLAYTMWFIVTKPRDLLKVMKFWIIVAIVYIALNLWWLILYFNALFSGYATHVLQSIDLGFMSGGSILESFRLLGMWAWKLGAYGTPYFPFWHHYYEFPIAILSFLLVIFAFISPILEKKNRLVLFFSVLAVLSLFLSKGIGTPLGDFYRYLYYNVPYFWIFREPYTKFTAVTLFSFSFLLGVSTSSISILIRKKSDGNKGILLSFLFMVFIISFILIVAFPLLNGEAIRSENSNGTMRSLYVDVPKYWYQAGDWLCLNDPHSRILLLPPGGYGVAYNWSHGFGGYSPAPVIFPNPTLIESFVDTPSNHILNLIFQKIENGSNPLKLIQLSCIKYIVIQNDLLWQYTYRKLDPKVIKDSLMKHEGFVFIKSFGNLDFYKIDDVHFLPHIYPATTLHLIDGSINEISQIVTSDNFTIDNSAFFLSNDLDREQIQFIKEHYNTVSIMENAPKISFQEINPTKYKIYINASQPFFLVFSESYNSQWKMYVEDKPVKFDGLIAEYPHVNVKEVTNDQYRFDPEDLLFLFSKPLNANYHFKVNGYANAWYIDPKEIDRDGTFTITLYFLPQSLFYLGSIVSGLTLVVCIGYLTYDLKYKRR
jgi:hypothetical protein